MKQLNIIKIGGKVVDNHPLLERFLDDFSALNGPKVLIHGGGNIASNLSRRLGVEVRMHEGRRITDADALDVAVMTYAGLVNKRLIAALQSRDCNAIGLSGADLNLIKAWKRSDEEIDYGFVGDADDDSIDSKMLHRLLEIGAVPVFCAITHDGKGQLLNTNADTLAGLLARSLSPYYEVTLTFCFEKDGVLSDITDESSVIPELNHGEFDLLKKNGTIHEGMIPKLEGAFDALHNGVKEVAIRHPRNLLTETGTLLKK